jgi:hypothetical protein
VCSLEVRDIIENIYMNLKNIDKILDNFVMFHYYAC